LDDSSPRQAPPKGGQVSLSAGPRPGSGAFGNQSIFEAKSASFACPERLPYKWNHLIGQGLSSNSKSWSMSIEKAGQLF
jgi:hypothetical protein